MKLGKDEIQKIVLGAILVVIVIYVYFTVLLGPLESSQVAAKAAVASQQVKLTEAQKQIQKTAGLEATAPKATLTVKQLSALIPEGSPVAWFPPQVADFFKREGIEKSATRMNGETAEKDLPGFRRITWGIEVPRVDFATLARALADFENEQLLTEIDGLQIDSLHDDPETQRANLIVNSIVKQ